MADKLGKKLLSDQLIAHSLLNVALTELLTLG